jgi:nucleotide sugar dehydrogenase
MTKISIIGLGFVGNAMFESFTEKTKHRDDYVINGHDKYKNGGIGELNDCITSDIIFTALPTLYDELTCSYNNSPTMEVLDELNERGYKKIIVIKSTVDPLFTESLSSKYSAMSFIHNPEFLTARTAYEDFHNQKHIVLGKTNNCTVDAYELVKKMYSDLYEEATISTCTSTESESMKVFCNSFYAIKIQYFNELYLLSQKLGTDFNKVVKLMINNGWINEMHTNVPGPDGKLSYGGLCFPKDTKALLEFMKKNDSACKVLEACVKERDEMRQ